MGTHVAFQHYQKTSHEIEVNGANSHKLIQMLMAGALTRIAEARGQFDRGDKSGFGESVGKTIGIISGLQAALDFERGGEISKNLESLYDYMVRTLLSVHSENSVAPLNEVASLLSEIKEAWDAISEECC